MKKIIVILLIILILVLPLIIAECPPDCTKEDLEKNPDIINNLNNDQLISTINKEVKVLNNPKVLEFFENRLKKDIKIINNNPAIKEKWLGLYKIDSEVGSEIKSYDGKIIETNGKESTKFEVNKYPEAKITKNGALILKTGQKIASGELKSNKNSIDIIINKNGYFQDENGKVKSSFEKDININLNGKYSSITGEFKISKIENEEEKTSYEVSGKITTNSQDKNHLIIEEKTKITSYEGNNKWSFNTKNKLDYYDKESISDLMNTNTDLLKRSVEKISSIYKDSNGNLKVFSNKDNQINIELSKIESGDFFIKNIKTDIITDNSKINLKYSNEMLGSETILKFSKNSFNVEGDISNFQGIGISKETISALNLNDEKNPQIFIQTINKKWDQSQIGTSRSQEEIKISNEAIVARAIVEKTKGNDYVAVLVGVDNYIDKEIPKLQGSSNSVNAMEEFLIDNGFKGNIEKLYSPTKEEITEKIKQVEQNNPNKKILFYYSGHGIIDNKNDFYLAPTDVVTEKIGDNSQKVLKGGIGTKELDQMIPQEGRIIIADACHSGQLCKLPGAIITSSGSEQLSNEYEINGKIMGVFTSALTQKSSSEIDKSLEDIRKSQTLLDYLKNTPQNWKTTKMVEKRIIGYDQKPTTTGLIIENQIDDLFFIETYSFKQIRLPIFIYQK
jgi:hypothetical protein